MGNIERLVELEIGQQFDSIVTLEETMKKYGFQEQQVFVKRGNTRKLKCEKNQDKTHFAYLQQKFGYKTIDFQCKFGPKRESKSTGVRTAWYVFTFIIPIHDISIFIQSN